MEARISINNDEEEEQVNVRPLKAKLAVSPASLESQQANRHVNGEFTYVR